MLGSALRFSVAAWFLNLKMKSYPDFAPQVFNVLPQVFNILLKHIMAHCRIELLQNFQERRWQKMTADKRTRWGSLSFVSQFVSSSVSLSLSLSSSVIFLSPFVAVLVLALCFELFEPLLQLLHRNAATVLPWATCLRWSSRPSPAPQPQASLGPQASLHLASTEALYCKSSCWR